MPEPVTPTADDLFTANSDTADEIVGDVVPDSMPSGGSEVAEISEDDPLVPVDLKAFDQFDRPLYDEDSLEQWYYGDKDWEHEFVEFRGDILAVRKPQKQALSAFSLAASKHVKTKTQNDLTGLFIERHLSEATYDRVFSRMMDPDDVGYNTRSIGELIGKVVKLLTHPKEVDTVDSADDDDE